MSNCIPDVTSYMLGIQELRLGEAVAFIQKDPDGDKLRTLVVMALEEMLGGPFSVELLFAFPEVTHHLHNLQQFAEDIVTEALKHQTVH